MVRAPNSADLAFRSAALFRRSLENINMQSTSTTISRKGWKRRLYVMAHVPLICTTKMAIDKQMASIFGAAVTFRLLLVILFPGLPDLLTGRVEISTPVSSFKRCKYICGLEYSLFFADMVLPPHLVQEGLFLYTHHVSPYDGGVFHQVRLDSSTKYIPG
jgi:hypothetical protein